MKAKCMNGNIMVKLMMVIIMISVAATMALNISQRDDRQIYRKDAADVYSLQAKNAFDRISYHIKLAGYGNSNGQRPINIKHAEKSDTLIVWHNDVEIKYFVDFTNGRGILNESIDGSNRKIIEGVETLRFLRSTQDLATVEISLSQNRDKRLSGIVSRSYSTTLKLKSYL